MPTYKVKSPDGRIVTFNGETPPTDEDLDEIFSSLPVKKSEVKIPPKSSPVDIALSGFTGYGTQPGSEDILPMAGQMAGTPFGLPGSVVGATVGQTLRQGARALRGKGFDWPAIPKEAGATATVEGITRGVGRFLPKAANRMMLSVMKPARDVIKQNPNLGLDALEAGIYGTKSGMLDKAEKVIQEGERQILPLIKNRPQLVSTLNVADEIEKIKAPFLNVGDDASVAAIDEVKNAILKKGGIRKGGKMGFISLDEANQLKRDLYKVLKSSQYGKGVGEIPVKATARKQAAYGLKKEIEGAVPEVRGINRKIKTGIEAREALENRLAQEEKNNLLGLGNIGLGLGGLTTGAIQGEDIPKKLQLGLGYGLGAIAGKNVFGSSLSKTTLAKALISKLLGRATTLGSSELARMALSS